MAIAKQKIFKINSNIANLNQVLEKFVCLHCAHPIQANEFVEQVHGLTSLNTSNPCDIIYKEIKDLEKENNFEIPEVAIYSMDYSLENMQDYVYSTHERLKKLTNHRNEIEDLITKYKNALIQVNNIEDLDISLDDLFSCEYISTRVGRMPIDSIEKLKYYENKPYILKVFHEQKNYCWCMYLATNNFEREIDNIFSSLFFERIHIPDFVHGTPVSAQASLTMEIEVAEQGLADVEKEIAEIIKENINKLTTVKGELIFLEKINESKKYVVVLGDNFVINGFVTNKDSSKIKKMFADMDGVEVEILPPDSDQRIKPPTKLKNSWFAKPFGMFVEMYGLPGYNDIDPTPIVAITYSLLFGIMFGDLGQGLLLSLIGFLIYKRSKGKSKLAAVAIRIGLVSALFGFLYGSFFGNEEILTPIFTNIFGFTGKPIHVMDPNFTMTLLITTVALGSLLIITSMMLHMIISLRKKNYAELFFSHNGVAGLMLYVYAIAAVVTSILGTIDIVNPLTILAFVILPLILIVMKNPFERFLKGKKLFPESIGGFIIESIFELFEVLLSYVTNTMSFLRVGGFVLSHAGMMMVVYTLTDMSSSIFGQLLVLIIGNLFVMGLEGLIVGIQVLRLEFYEMFSRYFVGDGYPFETFE
ncbi:MAG: V-type ATP synthase subunit I [Tenericutes bacterium]|nr:V-type ATP synthase subunit I [Mycoplasmatota bacterium]